MKQIYTVVFLVLLLNGYCLIANGQETNPLDDEVKEAEARAKIAKAQREELENKFPAPDASALKGTTSVEGTPIESTIQAYKSFSIVAGDIAVAAGAKNVGGLYIYRDSDFKKIIEYKNLMQQLAVINTEYGKCFQGAAINAAIPPGVLAGIFLKWLPLLKTDTQIKNFAVTIEDEAAWALIAKAFAEKNMTLHNPFVSPYDFIDLSGVPSPNLVRELEKAQRFLTTNPCTNPTYTFKPQIDAAFIKLKTDLGIIIPPVSPAKKVTTTTTTDVPPTKKVEETVENTPAVTPTEIKFWDYARTEKLISTMQAGRIYWLVVKNVKAGGNVRIKSNPLIDIFRGGSSIKFSGGSLATYYILDNDGKIVVSDVIKGYEPYTKSSKIK
jgi:hypothetical protein